MLLPEPFWVKLFDFIRDLNLSLHFIDILIKELVTSCTFDSIRIKHFPWCLFLIGLLIYLSLAFSFQILISQVLCKSSISLKLLHRVVLLLPLRNLRVLLAFNNDEPATNQCENHEQSTKPTA